MKNQYTLTTWGKAVMYGQGKELSQLKRLLFEDLEFRKSTKQFLLEVVQLSPFEAKRLIEEKNLQRLYEAIDKEVGEQNLSVEEMVQAIKNGIKKHSLVRNFQDVGPFSSDSNIVFHASTEEKK